MAAAARDLQRPDAWAETYRMATDLAVANIDGAHAASLSMVRRTKRLVVNRAATQPTVAVADELQTDLGEGPCLDSISEGETTTSQNLGADGRWPIWGPRVVEQTGFRSVLSFQLFTHGDTLGALNLYSPHLDGFDAADRHDGLVLAAHVAIAIAAADKITHLDTALGTRTVIGQATGILMERYQVRPDVAFAILARTSSEEQVKLREIARILVETGEFGPLVHPQAGSDRPTPAPPHRP